MEETDITQNVYVAVYSGIQVYEMICRGIAVMRRHSDSWLNATQILKVAGVEKGRRTKILEREVLTGEHEKIQGGYGKYQGTWVPFTRGVQLCNQYNVYSHIRPILEHDPTANGTKQDDTPTKAEVRRQMKSTQKASLKREKVGLKDATSAKRFRPNSSAATSPLHSDMANGNNSGASGSGIPGTPNYPVGEGSVPRSTLLATPLRQTMYSSPAIASSAAGLGNWAYHMSAEETPLAAIVSAEAEAEAEAEASAASNDMRIKHDRTLLMNIFTTDDQGHIPEWLSRGASEVDVDLVIDDQGHTAVHWAAALARIHVLDLLLFQGADARKLNFEGESALVRAVQVTNNYETQTFPDLLELLHDTIPLTDKNNRTVLHHIAMAAGTEGREKAARYYADCLLSWIVRLAGGYQVDSDDVSLDEGDHIGSALIGAGTSTGLGNVVAQYSAIVAPKAAVPLTSVMNGVNLHLPTPTQSSSPNCRRNAFTKSVYDETTSHPAAVPQMGAGDCQILTTGNSAGLATSTTMTGESSTNADFAAFLNLQDVHGNTALNIAARIGDRAMVRMLFNAGASDTICNRVGLCPLDFGVSRIAEDAFDSCDGRTIIIESPTPTRPTRCPPTNGSSARHSRGAISSPMCEDVWAAGVSEHRMHQSMQSIQRLMTDLETNFAGEIRLKNAHFEDVKQQLLATTVELSKARETIHRLHAKTTRLTEIKDRVGYLEETLARETCAVREAIGALPPDSKPRQDLEELIDSLLDSPFVKPSDTDSALPAVPSLSLGDTMAISSETAPENWKAVVERLLVVNKVYARRDALLRDRVSNLCRRADVSERESQYRQLIAWCCDITEADVDIWIDRFVSAVESTDSVQADFAGASHGDSNGDNDDDEPLLLAAGPTLNGRRPALPSAAHARTTL
ncbi:transcriptional regulator swi6 [Kickxella alabastrina]|uniref:Transcriptional regulator swi6 n=1 Tax=Kickxella alabastrina TaxID=61397 RepID=A0ACC1IIG9_9FUNG|nr:transcriptional regulator swi6 [Kickxella alabastrina]